MQPLRRHKLRFKVGNKCTENECGLISAGSDTVQWKTPITTIMSFWVPILDRFPNRLRHYALEERFDM